MATLSILPRYEHEKKRLKGLENIWLPPKPVLTAQLLPYIDLMVAAEHSMPRNRTRGIPTINFHFWDVQARYLAKKEFPVQIIRNKDRIVKTAKKILQTQENTRLTLNPC